MRRCMLMPAFALLAVLMAWGPTVSSSAIGAAAGAATAPALVGPAPAEQVLELASGRGGEGLNGAIDDRTGQPIEVRVITPRFPGAYATIDGASWISDRFGPALADGTYQQARAYENSTGATIEPRPVAQCLPDGQCDDIGEAWHSTRTFRTSFTLPPLAAATSVTLQLAVDNVATVVLDAGDPAARQTLLTGTCNSFATCVAPGPTGEGHFSTATTVNVEPSRLTPGAHTLDFVVDDWGSVTGLSYKFTVRYLEAAVAATCAPSAQESCSLTVAPTPGAADQVRFCYSPPDDQARTLWIRGADGNRRPTTLAPHTWVDVATPADGLVRYPTELDAQPLADIADPSLTRCPGAVAASPVATP
jgi:hypothetical protein